MNSVPGFFTLYLLGPNVKNRASGRMEVQLYFAALLYGW